MNVVGLVVSWGFVLALLCMSVMCAGLAVSLAAHLLKSA
jgi:hypothetical protein